MTSRTSLIISGSRAEVGSSKRMISGLHAEAPGDGHPLLLAAGDLARILVGQLEDLDPLEVADGRLPGLSVRLFPDPDRREGAVFEHRQVGEEVEVLEYHPHVPADLVDALHVAGQLDAVHDDGALLVLLQPVDAADEGRFARPRGAADDDPLAPGHRQVDVLQRVELPVPFLEQAEEGVDDARDHQPEGLGQDDEPHHTPVAAAQGLGRFVLPPGNAWSPPRTTSAM